jgi:hypothetical protein
MSVLLFHCSLSGRYNAHAALRSTCGNKNETRPHKLVSVKSVRTLLWGQYPINPWVRRWQQGILNPVSLFFPWRTVLLAQNGESEPLNIRIRVNTLTRALLRSRGTENVVRTPYPLGTLPSCLSSKGPVLQPQKEKEKPQAKLSTSGSRRSSLTTFQGMIANLVPYLLFNLLNLVGAIRN